jgi:hypothetical protein
MGSRRLALVAIFSGLAVVSIAQHFGPIARPPLYDGVVVIDPYKWLVPPPGLAGGAQGSKQSFPANSGWGIGTPEQPPQLQVGADLGYLSMPKDTTAIEVSAEPVAPPAAAPAKGTIAGNVYRIDVTNQRGVALTPKPGDTVVIVLRGPPDLPSATIERYSKGTWTPLNTDSAGIPNIFSTSAPGFGEFALVAPAGWVPAGESQTSSPVAGASASVAPVASVAPAGPTTAAEPTDSTSGAGNPPGSGPSAVVALVAVMSVLILGAIVIVLIHPGKPPKS